MLATFMPLLGCTREYTPAIGTLVVHIDTNAPVLTNFDKDRSMPLFDSVRVELLTPDGSLACAACQREFPASEDQFRNGLSFGITKPSRSDLRIRARMFLSGLAGTEIDPRVTVSVMAPLMQDETSQVPDQGTKHASLFLDVRDVGIRERTASLEPYTGAGSLVYNWAWAHRIGCVGNPRSDEACVKGGAFWLGAASGALSVEPERSARRLIALEPYFLLDHEVTVAELRAFLGTHLEFGNNLHKWSGALDGKTPTDWCTYTPEPSELDLYPVNCVDDILARAYCQAQGGDLPTEAQFEYVAGAFNGRPFVWGLDIPSCEYAVYGRHTQLTPWSTAYSDSTCGGPTQLDRNLLGTPIPSKELKVRDFLHIDGHAILHLAGNLSEWALDEYEARAGACWSDLSRPNFAHDPVCTQVPNDTSARRYLRSRTGRGGSWLEGMPALASNYRFEAESGQGTAWIGFRCARPASTRSP